MLAALRPWKEIIDAKGMQIVGHTESLLLRSSCEFEECNLGQFLADVFVYHYKKFLCAKQGGLCTDQIIGLINSGAMRANINAGGEFDKHFSHFHLFHK